MTISKDRLNELALGIIDAHGLDISMQSAEIFAHALIKRIEQEAEVVGYDWQTQLIALPIIEGD